MFFHNHRFVKSQFDSKFKTNGYLLKKEEYYNYFGYTNFIYCKIPKTNLKMYQKPLKHIMTNNSLYWIIKRIGIINTLRNFHEHPHFRELLSYHYIPSSISIKRSLSMFVFM